MEFISDHVITSSTTGSVRRGQIDSRGYVETIAVSKVSAAQSQLSLFKGNRPKVVQVGYDLINWLPKIGKQSNGKYQLKEMSHDEAIIIDTEFNQVVLLHILKDIKQMGVANVMLTGPKEFSVRITRLAEWHHYHIHGYYLHLHEMTGRTGNRKKCQLHGDCENIANTTTERSLFEHLGMQYIIPNDRSIDRLRSEERRIFGV